MSLALELAWKTSLYFMPTLFVKKSTSEDEKWANGFHVTPRHGCHVFSQ